VGDDGGVVGSSSSSVSSGSGIMIVVDLGRRFGNGHVRKAFSNSANESEEFSVRAVKPSFFNNSTRFIRRVDVLQNQYFYIKYQERMKKFY
jgi:hypothetical protein